MVVTYITDFIKVVVTYITEYIKVVVTYITEYTLVYEGLTGRDAG